PGSRGRRLCCSGPGWGGRSGLRTLEINHRLGDIHGRTGPKHWTIRPRIRSVNDYAETLVCGVLYQHRTHLLQDALRNLVLLVLGIVPRVLYLPLQGFLLLLDLFYQRAPALVVELLTLGVELLL